MDKLLGFRVSVSEAFIKVTAEASYLASPVSIPLLLYRCLSESDSRALVTTKGGEFEGHLVVVHRVWPQLQLRHKYRGQNEVVTVPCSA